jgi:hypothetical protein
MKFKYVMIDNGIPVIFPEAFTHSHIKGNITSAGFFRVDKRKVTCYGFSQSLNTKPEPSDEQIIERVLNCLMEDKL